MKTEFVQWLGGCDFGGILTISSWLWTAGQKFQHKKNEIASIQNTHIDAKAIDWHHKQVQNGEDAEWDQWLEYSAEYCHNESGFFYTWDQNEFKLQKFKRYTSKGRQRTAPILIYVQINMKKICATKRETKFIRWWRTSLYKFSQIGQSSDKSFGKRLTPRIDKKFTNIWKRYVCVQPSRKLNSSDDGGLLCTTFLRLVNQDMHSSVNVLIDKSFRKRLTPRIHWHKINVWQKKSMINITSHQVCGRRLRTAHVLTTNQSLLLGSLATSRRLSTDVFCPL